MVFQPDLMRAEEEFALSFCGGVVVAELMPHDSGVPKPDPTTFYGARPLVR